MAEKAELPAPSAGAAPSRQRRRVRLVIAGLCALAVLTYRSLNSRIGQSDWYEHVQPTAGSTAAPAVYTQWDDIPPSETLNWVPCFPYNGPRFLCARLTVPMDYSRPLTASPDHPKVHIAMVMLPGPGHGLVTGRFSDAPLLVNPGGPGGQGTEFVLEAGGALQLVAGGRDVVGFDPRGIGATVPPADCFLPPGAADRSDALMHRYTFQVMGHDSGLPNATADALAKHAFRIKALAKMCEQRAGNQEIFGFVGTPNVARDMKTIVDAWDAWMEGEGFVAEAPFASSAADGTTVPVPSVSGKLVYWGFSYGTLLGATYAAMFRMWRPADSRGRCLTNLRQRTLLDG